MSVEPLGGVLLAVETERALELAAARRSQELLGTLEILAAVIDTHAGRGWATVQLRATFVSAEDAMQFPDPDPSSQGVWRDAPLTRDAATALAVAARIAEGYGLLPMPPGVLALGLVSNSLSGAATALLNEAEVDHGEILDLIQDELLGSALEGLTDSLQELARTVVLEEEKHALEMPPEPDRSPTPELKEQSTNDQRSAEPPRAPSSRRTPQRGAMLGFPGKRPKRHAKGSSGAGSSRGLRGRLNSLDLVAHRGGPERVAASVTNQSVASFDVFVSYARSDRELASALRDALSARGLSVWMDDSQIDTFTSISAAVEQGLAHSTAMVAIYSHAYPAARACQWELTAAFVTARAGGDPRRRVLVVNPHEGIDHLHPVELRDGAFAAAPTAGDARAHEELARRVERHIKPLRGTLGELGVSVRPPWFGRQPVGAARFVGRVAEMWAVHSALSAGDVGLITGGRGDPVVSLIGMGGTGKSLLVEEYSLRFGAAYPGGVFWLRAHGHDEMSETFGDQAREAERGTQLLGFLGALGLDTEELTPEQVHAVLARQLDERAQPFLWIVDDLAPGLDRRRLDGWIAPGRFGRTLLTTRSREYGAIGSEIQLGVLGPSDGAELLRKHRQPDGALEERAARLLVADLGGHALALDVAGAALAAEDGVRGYAAYGAALADLREDELALAASFIGELPTGHEACITTTLARSIRHLDHAGSDFLRLASQLAVAPIPADLVVDVFRRIDGLANETARQRAVTGMHQAVVLSLANTTDGRGAREVHTLVSRTMRLLEIDSARLSAIATAATAALTSRFRITGAGRVSADSLTVVHARHVATPLREQQHAAILNLVGLHDVSRGDYAGAGTVLQRALGAYGRLLGVEHPDTLRCTTNLANALHMQGDIARARSVHERALETFRHVLGEDHPDTLMSMNGLAAALQANGDLTSARTLHEEVLDSYRRVFTDEHPKTLMSMNNLAETLWAQGERAAARALHEQVLVTSRRVLGDEHPDTLTSMSNLADSLRAMGDLERARSLLEQGLESGQRVLGEEHPATLGFMNLLAETYWAQGDTRRARALHERALEGYQRELGHEHPSTLASMTNLAATLCEQGHLVDARHLQEQTLEGCKRTLGDDHPLTLTSMNNLAETMSAQRDLAQARLLQEEVLDKFRRILGKDHPETLASMNNLALTLGAQGDLVGARTLHEQELAACQRVLGRDHPDTLGSMHNLAETLREQGDSQGARALHEQVLEARQRVLGSEHPATEHSAKLLAALVTPQPAPGRPWWRPGRSDGSL